MLMLGVSCCDVFAIGQAHDEVPLFLHDLGHAQTSRPQSLQALQDTYKIPELAMIIRIGSFEF